MRVVHDQRKALARACPVSKGICHVQVVLWEGCHCHHIECTGLLLKVCVWLECLGVPAKHIAGCCPCSHTVPLAGTFPAMGISLVMDGGTLHSEITCSIPPVASLSTNAVGIAPACVKAQRRAQYTSVWKPTPLIKATRGGLSSSVTLLLLPAKDFCHYKAFMARNLHQGLPTAY